MEVLASEIVNMVLIKRSWWAYVFGILSICRVKMGMTWVSKLE